MSKRTTLILVLLITIGVSFVFFQKTLVGHLVWWEVRMNSAGLKLTDSYSEEVGTSNIDWIVSESGDVKLFLGKVKSEDPKKYIEDKIYSLMSLYQPSISPYPEVITNTIDCSDKFKPVQEDFGFGKVYKVLAGERYSYGICSDDLVKYYSLYGLFDCGKKGVFELKIFSQNGISREEEIMRSFNCKGFGS